MIKIETNKLGSIYLSNPDLIRFRDSLKSIPGYPYQPDTDEFDFPSLSALTLDLADRAAGNAAEKDTPRLQAEITGLQKRLQEETKRLQDAITLQSNDFKVKSQAQQNEINRLMEAKLQSSVPELEFVRLALEKQRNKPVTPAEAFAYLKQLWIAGHPFPKIKTAQ